MPTLTAKSVGIFFVTLSVFATTASIILMMSWQVFSSSHLPFPHFPHFSAPVCTY